jgi:hypothetical protein
LCFVRLSLVSASCARTAGATLSSPVIPRRHRSLSASSLVSFRSAFKPSLLSCLMALRVVGRTDASRGEWRCSLPHAPC